MQLLRKKVALLERKIAEHERAAGGSLAELQVGWTWCVVCVCVGVWVWGV